MITDRNPPAYYDPTPLPEGVMCRCMKLWGVRDEKGAVKYYCCGAGEPRDEADKPAPTAESTAPRVDTKMPEQSVSDPQTLTAEEAENILHNCAALKAMGVDVYRLVLCIATAKVAGFDVEVVQVKKL